MASSNLEKEPTCQVLRRTVIMSDKRLAGNDTNDELRIKPNVMCPHCEESFNAGELASRKLGRTKWGIDVFTCPNCNGYIKIEPAEYFYVARQLRAGELPEGVGIVAFKSEDLTPSEKVARSSQNPLRRIFGL